MDAIWQAEILISLFFQNLGAWLAFPMRLFTFLGDQYFFLLVMPAFYWSVDTMIGFRVGIMLLLSNGVNNVLKLIFQGPRPFWIDPRVRGMVTEISFGMPSGHAQNSAAIWGLFAWLAKRRWLTITLLAVILLVGLSRIYLGMHFTSDVIAGWIIGAVLVWVFSRLDKPITSRVKSMRLSSLITLMFLFSLFLILIIYIPILLGSNYQLPAVWLENARLSIPDIELAPFDPEGAYTVAGTWFGFTAGAAWLFTQKGSFNASGPFLKRLLRYLIGAAGVLILYLGLSSIFPDKGDMLSYSLRYLRYALIGSWISLAAPVLFVRLRLSAPFQKSPAPTEALTQLPT